MKRILWGLALVIIPAFVLWGAVGLLERGRYAGSIFGKKISYEDYGKSYTAVRNLAVLMYGSKYNEMREGLNLEQAAWDRLIVLTEARKKKIKIQDAEVIGRIASLGVFQAKEGYFDQRNYTMILGNILRTTPRDFEEQVRESLMIERLITQVFATAALPTEEEIQEAMKLAPETKPEGEDRKEETPEQKRERAKSAVLMTKRMDLYQAWHDELYKRAHPISLVETQKETPAEETVEAQATETSVPAIPETSEGPPQENTPQ